MRVVLKLALMKVSLCRMNKIEWYIFNNDGKILKITESQRQFESEYDEELDIEIHKEYIISNCGQKVDIDYCFPTIEELEYKIHNSLAETINTLKVQVFYHEQLLETLSLEIDGFKTLSPKK